MSADPSDNDDPEEDLMNQEPEDTDMANSDHDLDEELKDSENTGPAVNAKIAQLVNTRLTKPLANEKLKEKVDKYKRPENVEFLNVTQVNPAIWADMRPETRVRDMKLKKVQSYLIKGFRL